MNQRLTIYLSIAAGLILVGVWLYIVDLGQVLAIIKKIRIWLIIPLGILFFLIYFLRSLRWKVMLSPVEHISVSESFHLSMTNYFINFLIPVHAGELVKSMLLKKMKGTPVSKSLLSVYLDKLTDLLPLFLLVILTPFIAKELNNIIYWASGILLLALLLLMFFLIFLAQKKSTAEEWLKRIFFFLPVHLQMKLRNFLDLFVEGIFSLSKLSANGIIAIFGLTLLALIAHCFFMWLFFYSFGINLSALTVLVGYLLLNAAFILPAPPGFVGTLEIAFVFIFTYIYGYDKNLISAVAASSHVFIAVLFGLTGFVSIALIGTSLTSVLKIGSGNKIREITD
jgi:uncharacterized protein (TIRG00374 family)